MSEIKICLFADFHYWPKNHVATIPQLEEIVEAAHANGVDAMVCCGDLCHNMTTAPELVETYFHNKYGIPAMNCFGNHEQEAVDSIEEVWKIQGMTNSYDYFDLKGFRFIITDTNYYLEEDGSLHHVPARSWGKANGDRMSPEQLAWLEKTIDESPYPCMLFSHATFEAAGGCPDHAAVRAIIDKANKKNPGRVLMCCNGHYHRDNITIKNNVVYFDVNSSLNVEWQPRPNTMLPQEFIDSARMAVNHTYSKEPLYAIVTIRDDGTISIEGKESDYLFGASPEAIGWNTGNQFGRETSPRISSADIKLHI